MSDIIQFLPTLILAVLLIVPVWRIVKRAGFNPWLSLLALVPIANIVALWLFSKKPWPSMNR